MTAFVACLEESLNPTRENPRCVSRDYGLRGLQDGRTLSRGALHLVIVGVVSLTVSLIQLDGSACDNYLRNEHVENNPV